MTEKSNDSTTPSGDTNNVLPLLSEAKAPVTVSLTVDRSVKTVAGWVMAALGVLIFLTAFMAFVAWDARDSSFKAETQLQLINDWLAAHGVEKRGDRYYFRQEKLDGE